MPGQKYLDLYRVQDAEDEYKANLERELGIRSVKVTCSLRSMRTIPGLIGFDNRPDGVYALFKSDGPTGNGFYSVWQNHVRKSGSNIRARRAGHAEHENTH